MAVGLFIFCCAIIVSVLGLLKPVYKVLKISPVYAVSFMLIMLILGLINPGIALLLPMIGGFICLINIRWARAGLLAMMSAFCASLLALIIVIYGVSDNGGFICGAASSTLAVISCRHRRARLFAASMCMPLAVLFASLIENISKTILATTTNGYYNATVAALVWGVLLSAALQAIKLRQYRTNSV